MGVCVGVRACVCGGGWGVCVCGGEGVRVIARVSEGGCLVFGAVHVRVSVVRAGQCYSICSFESQVWYPRVCVYVVFDCASVYLH